MPGPDDAVGDTYTQSGGEKSMRGDSSVWRPAECGIISDTRVQSAISLVVPRCSRHYNASLSLLGGRMRPVVTASAILFLLISSAALDGQGQNFVFEEESRLPADPSPPGTSTTDVDLVDVDGDGDPDLFKA